MTIATELLDRWKKAQGIESDNAAAIKLRVTRSAISSWRQIGKKPEAATVKRMAEDLGEDPTGYVLMIESEKQKSADSKRAMVELARKFGPFAACILLYFAHTSTSSAAITVPSGSDGYTNPEFYISRTGYTFTSIKIGLQRGNRGHPIP